MSYTKIKKISIKKNGDITITGASNNVRPLNYSTFTFNGDKKDLLLTLLSGDGQLNDSVYNFRYAMYRLRELENYSDLIKDIDAWKWDWNDEKKYFYTGKSYRPNYETELDNVTDDYILIHETKIDNEVVYSLYMLKTQYNELKQKYEMALDKLSKEFYEFLDEKKEGQYTLYSEKYGYITHKKNYFTYSVNKNAGNFGDFKKMYCDLQKISNNDYYNIYIKEVNE